MEISNLVRFLYRAIKVIMKFKNNHFENIEMVVEFLNEKNYIADWKDTLFIAGSMYNEVIRYLEYINENNTFILIIWMPLHWTS